MNDWAEIMGRRDRLAALLRPHLGKGPARERANDIIQALLCAEERADEVALRMLARDLEPRAAEVVAFQVGRAWVAPKSPTSDVESSAPGPLAVTPSSEPLPLVQSAQGGARIKRPRRETTLLSELPEAIRRFSGFLG